MITLVSPPVSTDEGILPPLGLIAIGSFLLERDIEVSLIDLACKVNSNSLNPNGNFYDRCVDLLIESKNLFFGFNTQNVTLPSALNIAKRLKQKLPNSVIVFGGSGSDYLSTQILSNFPWIDFIVLGEGEITLYELLITYSQNQTFSIIDGLVWKTNDTVVVNPRRNPIKNLNELPAPNYDHFIALESYSNIPPRTDSTIIIELARGCNFNCSFCGCSAFWEKKRRIYPLKKVFKLISELYKKYNVGHFYITDDNFTATKDTAVEFLRGLIELNLPITWDTRSRIDNVDDEILSLLRKSGCKSILFGVESSSNEMLMKMQKGIKSEDQYAAIIRTSKIGILPILSFILGHPDETMESLNETLYFVLQLHIETKFLAVHFHLLSVIPGTKSFLDYQDNLVLDQTTSFGAGLNYCNEEILDEDLQLIKKHPDLFSGFYNVESPIIPLPFLSFVSYFAPDLLSMFTFTIYLIKEYDGYSVYNQLISIYNIYDDDEIHYNENKNTKYIVIKNREKLYRTMVGYSNFPDLISDMFHFEESMLGVTESVPIYLELNYDVLQIREDIKMGNLQNMSDYKDRKDLKVEKEKSCITIVRC